MWPKNVSAQIKGCFPVRSFDNSKPRSSQIFRPGFYRIFPVLTRRGSKTLTCTLQMTCERKSKARTSVQYNKTENHKLMSKLVSRKCRSLSVPFNCVASYLRRFDSSRSPGRSARDLIGRRICSNSERHRSRRSSLMRRELSFETNTNDMPIMLFSNPPPHVAPSQCLVMTTYADHCLPSKAYGFK